jgi:hypothetical protein
VERLIIMFKSKHSGWTFAGTRTPFGRGSWTNQIVNDISSVLGTDGGGGGIIGNTENIIQSAGKGNPLDVASAILGTDGSGLGLSGALAQTDNSVNTLVPGGWATVALIAATIASAGTASPALAAELGGELAAEGALAAGAEAGAAGAAGAGAGSAAAADSAFMAYDAANLAANGYDAATIAQNLQAGYGITAEQAAQLGAASASAYASSGAAPAGFETIASTPTTPTPGADAVLNSPTQISNLTPPGAGNFGTITPPTAGAVTGAGGLTGGMGAGTMVGDGTLGTTIGQSYMAAGPGQFAVNASGAAIPAGASGIAGTVPSSGLSASDILNNAKRAKNLSDALKQGASSGLSNSLGQLAQGANPQGQALGAAVRGNPNPFTFSPQQPIQDAKPLDLASLANLLKQG